MRAKWLLEVGYGALGTGFFILCDLYPTAVQLSIQTALGVSADTALDIIVILWVLFVSIPITIFVVINVRDYYNKNPTKTRRIVSRTMWGVVATASLLIAVGYSSLIILLSTYYTAMTSIGAVFFSTLFFSMVISLGFAVWVLKSPPKRLRSTVLPIALMAFPYVIITSVALSTLIGAPL